MLWLQRPPWIRWIGATLLAVVAVVTELSPPPTVEATFLAVDVAAGTRLEPSMVTSRRIPAGAVETVDPLGHAAADLLAGDPLVPSMLTEVSIPDRWVVLEAPLPQHARPGDRATGVVVDPDGAPIEFAAMVVDRPVVDTFGSGLGTIAVPADWLGVAATAVATGRLVVGVEGGSR